MKLLIILLLVIVGLYLLFKAFSGKGAGSPGTDSDAGSGDPAELPSGTSGNLADGSGVAGSGSAANAVGSAASAGSSAVAAGAGAVAAVGATAAGAANASANAAAGTSAGRASSAVNTGDELHDVHEMLKILNLRDSDASRLAIDKAQYNDIKAGNVSGLPDAMIADVAGKLRKMLS